MRLRLLAAALSTTCLSTLPALADVTPDEVWTQNKEMMMTMLGEVSAEEVHDGDTLVIRDMTSEMVFETPEGNITSTTIAPEIRFEPIKGGKVSIRYSAPLSSVTTIPADPVLETPEFNAESTTTIEGLTVVSGTPDDMLYTMDGMAFVVTSEPTIIDGTMVQPGIKLAIDQIIGTTTIERDGETLISKMDMVADTVTYGIEPFTAEGAELETAFTASDLRIGGDFVLQTQSGDDYIANILGNSDMNVTMRSERSSSTFRMVDEDGNTVEVLSKTGPSLLGFTLNDGAIGYEATGENITATVAASQLPGDPLAFSMDSSAVSVLFPLAASDEAQPYKLSLGLESVVLPDLAWMIADPQNTMPHDPATLRLDLGGTMENGIDLFDTAALAAAEADGEMPVAMKTVDLSELFLSLAGAEIKGQGQGHFLEAEPAIPGGMPPFAGTLSLNMKGLLGLLDNLTASGLVQQEQAMSFRMMLSLFARPGDGEDEMVSDLEMTEDGQIIANGQPLPF
nr:hypothetical protein [uncultured Celeribacter sp.]